MSPLSDLKGPRGEEGWYRDRCRPLPKGLFFVITREEKDRGYGFQDVVHYNAHLLS